MSTLSHADMLHERPLQMLTRCMSALYFLEVLHVHLHLDPLVPLVHIWTALCAISSNAELLHEHLLTR